MRAVTQALIQKCDLLEWDPAGDTSVWIKQARGLEEGRRDLLFTTMKMQDQEIGEPMRIVELPGPELVILECWLTFDDANIMEEVKIKETVDAGDGKKKEEEKVKLVSMFSKSMSEKDFRRAFNRLDRTLIVEWHAKVWEVNPHWAPGGLEELEKN